MRIGSKRFNITPIELGLILTLVAVAIIVALPIFFKGII